MAEVRTVNKTMDIEVNCSRPIGALEHFWCSTGFAPAELLLCDDMRQSLTYVGSLPGGGIKYLRVHYLLALITVHDLAGDTPRYDFDKLDTALDVIASNALKPIFQLMGNTSDYFTDFCDDNQIHTWKRLVTATAKHLIRRYGQQEVESWFFETWNEPDTDRTCPKWPEDGQAFCNYYDACSEGLREAHRSLRFGGPATGDGLSPIFKTLLEHCDTGKNYFTGDRGVRLDFISVHAAGSDAPDTARLCREEEQIFEYVRERHPQFADLPFMNDECFFAGEWDDDHIWRGGPCYAALCAKAVNQHVNVLIDDQACRYSILSNYNGFVGPWGQRTLLARMGDGDDFAAGRFELIKKPALNVMAMMGLLGETRLETTRIADHFSDLGVLATRLGQEQIAVMIYHSSDDVDASGNESVHLCLDNFPFEQAVLAHYRIDAEHGNPLTLWEQMGRPAAPSAEQLVQLREHQNLAQLEPPREVTAEDGRFELDFDLPLPGVSLILLSDKPAEEPSQITGLQGRRYEGLHGGGQVMLSWTALDSRVIKSYTVHCSAKPEGRAVRISGSDLICSALLHTPAPRGPIVYKVSATDYWGRTGPATELTVP